MNEILMNDKSLSIDRTPQLIAVEINGIKEATQIICLNHSIEIGRCLCEAKSLIKHGEWGNWLKESVNYSKSTANYLMRMFEDYGANQLSLFGSEAKSQALRTLSYTQAVALLGIPQDEREDFIQDHDIENMSTRELKQAIKDKQELETKLKEAEDGWERDKTNIVNTDKILRETLTNYHVLENELAKEKDESKAEIIRLGQSIEDMNKALAEAQASGDTKEVEHLNKLLVETDGELHTAYKKIEDLELQLKEPIDVTAAEVIEKIPEEVGRELAELRAKNKELEAKGVQPINTATIRFGLQFDSLVKGFGDILRVLGEIDGEEHQKYKNVVRGLIGKMSEKL